MKAGWLAGLTSAYHVDRKAVPASGLGSMQQGMRAGLTHRRRRQGEGQRALMVEERVCVAEAKQVKRLGGAARDRMLEGGRTVDVSRVGSPGGCSGSGSRVSEACRMRPRCGGVVGGADELLQRRMVWRCLACGGRRRRRETRRRRGRSAGDTAGRRVGSVHCWRDAMRWQGGVARWGIRRGRWPETAG